MHCLANVVPSKYLAQPEVNELVEHKNKMRKN